MRLIALLLLVSHVGLSQAKYNTLDIIPNSSSASVGELRFRDTEFPLAHYVGFKSSGFVPGNVVWQLPSADAAGCLTSNGAAILNWGSCGGNVSNGFVVTGQSNVSPPTTTVGLQVYYDPVAFSAFIKSYNGSNLPAPIQVVSTAFEPAVDGASQVGSLSHRWGSGWFSGSISAGGYHVAVDNLFDVGQPTLAIENVYAHGYFIGTGQVIDSGQNAVVNNITINGTCSGPGCVSGGSFVTLNTNQTITGLKTFANNILFGTDDTYSVGDKFGNRPLVFASTANARKVEVTDLFGSGNSWNITAAASFLNNYMFINDGNNNPVVKFLQRFANASDLEMIFNGNVEPMIDSIYNLGIPGHAFGAAFLTNGIFINGSQFIDNNRNVQNLNSLTMGSGNFYNRVFAGTPSCTGVQDGWQGVDTSGIKIWVCVGGVARFAVLN